MPVVGAAAAAKHIDMAEAVAVGPVLLAKFQRVSGIKLSCLVKFGMTDLEALARMPRMRLVQSALTSVESKWVGWAQLTM